MSNIDKVKQFRKSFDQLTSEEQEVLMLRHIDGQSLRNLAITLELPSLKYSRNLVRDLEIKVLNLMADY